jgi:uncharacterized membrane protein (DUF485 family)
MNLLVFSILTILVFSYIGFVKYADMWMKEPLYGPFIYGTLVMIAIIYFVIR